MIDTVFGRKGGITKKKVQSGEHLMGGRIEQKMSARGIFNPLYVKQMMGMCQFTKGGSQRMYWEKQFSLE